MKLPTKKTFFTISGMVLFFLTVALTVAVALFAFVLVNRNSGGNTVAITVTMLIIIFGLSVVFTFADVIRRRIMVYRPVQKILRATERLTAGDFSTRVHSIHSYERYDEYDLIMENLNIMAAELQKSEILKTDFISNVSHELKTPLAIIQSYATLLGKPDLDDETRRKYAATVADATRRLADLVANILQLNKLENQQLSPECKRVALDALLAERIVDYEEMIEKKEISLNLDIDEMQLVTAEGLVEIIFNNLFSNALKFTDRGGEISVSLKKEGENAVLRVSDTGCGISPETGAHIFDKFYQGDTSHSGEGNGLGLALVKKVIDLLGGEIFVTSEVGVGSTFTVVLREIST